MKNQLVSSRYKNPVLTNLLNNIPRPSVIESTINFGIPVSWPSFIDLIAITNRRFSCSFMSKIAAKSSTVGDT